MDSETWDCDGAYVVEPDPTREVGLRLTLRFNAEESRIRGNATQAANMPITRFIKHVTLETAKRAPNVLPNQNRGVA